jgi:hypothetical protein
MSSPPSKMTLPTTSFTSRHRHIITATSTSCNPDRRCEYNSFSWTGLSTRSRQSLWSCRPHCNDLPYVFYMKVWRILVLNACVLAWPHATGGLACLKTLNSTAPSAGDAPSEKHPTTAQRRSHYNAIQKPRCCGNEFTST